MNKYKPNQEEANAWFDAVRASGQINMFGAPAMFRKAFDVTEAEAKTMFWEWTKNFGPRERMSTALCTAKPLTGQPPCPRPIEDKWLGYCAKHEKLYHNALDDAAGDYEEEQ